MKQASVSSTDQGGGKCGVRARFCACANALPADQAAPLWRAALTEAQAAASNGNVPVAESPLKGKIPKIWFLLRLGNLLVLELYDSRALQA